MTHALKTWSIYYQSLVDGSKTFEIRKDDRPFNIGDTFLAQEYNFSTKEYTGSEEPFEITYILREAVGFGLIKGFVILGIKPIKQSDY